jgi:hypothetical protein
MSITAYAAGVADPENNSTTDPTVVQGDVANDKEVTLYGDASDTTNNSWPAANGSDVTWAWALLNKPTGSSAAFKVVNGTSTATSQNPIITPVDEWGNYRLFLVATNTTTSTTSEADPLKAPDSAFVTIRVTSTNAGIQKPAAGARNWHDNLHEWADKIDTNSAGDTHTLNAGNTDVGDATGADLVALTQGGAAFDPANTANPLHKHRGDHVDRAGYQLQPNGTSSAFNVAYPGVVYLEEAPDDLTAPTVLTQERIVYTGTANVTNSVKEITVQAEPNLPEAGANITKEQSIHTIVTSDYIEKIVNTTSGIEVGGRLYVPNYHIAFFIREAVTLNNWSVALQDGGSNDAATLAAGYEFELKTAVDAAALKAGTLVTVTNSDLEPVPTQYHGASGAESSHLNVTLAAGSYLCVVCLRHPADYFNQTLDIIPKPGFDATPYTFGRQQKRGRNLSATINCIRPIG